MAFGAVLAAYSCGAAADWPGPQPKHPAFPLHPCGGTGAWAEE